MSEEKTVLTEHEIKKFIENARQTFKAALDSLVGTPVEAVVSISVIAEDGQVTLEVAHTAHCHKCASEVAMIASNMLAERAKQDQAAVATPPTLN